MRDQINLGVSAHSPVVQRYDVENLDAAYGRILAARGAMFDPRAARSLRGLGAGELSTTTLIGGTVLAALILGGSAFLLFQAAKGGRRGSLRGAPRAGTKGRKFSVRSAEYMRPGTAKVVVDAGNRGGRDGELWITVYPDPLPMRIYAPGSEVQWLEADLSSSEMSKVRAAAKRALVESV